MPGLLLLGARARCGSRKNGKEDRSQIGTFRSSRSRGAQTCSGAMEGNQAWTGGEACSLSHGQQQPTDRAGGERRRGRGKSWVVPIAGGVGPIGGLSRGGPFGPSWFMLPIGPAPLPALGCPGQVMGLSMASANLVDCGA